MRAVLAPAWWLRLSSGALCQQLSSSPCSSACKGCAHQHPSLTPSKHEQLCAPPAADAGAGGLPTLCFCPCAQSREQAGTRDSECSSPNFASGAAPRRAGWLCPSCCWPRGDLPMRTRGGGRAGQGSHAPGGEEPTRAVGTLARSTPAGVEVGTPRCYRTFPSCSSGCVSVAKATGEPGAGRTSDPQSPGRRGTGGGWHGDPPAWCLCGQRWEQMQSLINDR